MDVDESSDERIRLHGQLLERNIHAYVMSIKISCAGQNDYLDLFILKKAEAHETKKINEEDRGAHRIRMGKTRGSAQRTLKERIPEHQCREWLSKRGSK